MSYISNGSLDYEPRKGITIHQIKKLEFFITFNLFQDDSKLDTGIILP